MALFHFAENHVQKRKQRAFQGAEMGFEWRVERVTGGLHPRVSMGPRGTAATTHTEADAPFTVKKRPEGWAPGSAPTVIRGPGGPPLRSTPGRARGECTEAYGSTPGKSTDLLRSLRELLDAELFVEISPDKEGENSSPNPVDGVGEAQNEHLGFLALLGLLLGAVAAPGADGERGEGGGEARGAEQGTPGVPGRQRRGPRSWRTWGRGPAEVAAAEAAESGQGRPPLGSAGGPRSGGSSGQSPRQKPAG